MSEELKKDFIEEENTEIISEEDIENITEEDIPDDIVDEAAKEFHLDPTSGEDRQRILDAYKKSLHKRVFAPIVGKNEYLNPIDILKAEEEEKRLQGTLNMYDLMERRIDKLEKELRSALLMSKVGTAIAVIAVLMIGIMFSVLKIK